jgi:hypothetical protein
MGPMALREFMDGRGKSWRVWDTRPRGGTVREDYRDGWLTFEQGVARRRLVPIPDGWAELSDEALRELCVAARPERSRRRLAE